MHVSYTRFVVHVPGTRCMQRDFCMFLCSAIGSECCVFCNITLQIYQTRPASLYTAPQHRRNTRHRGAAALMYCFQTDCAAVLYILSNMFPDLAGVRQETYSLSCAATLFKVHYSSSTTHNPYTQHSSTERSGRTALTHAWSRAAGGQ